MFFQKITDLITDIRLLLGPQYGYGKIYLTGIFNTLTLAVLATAVGCLIGFVCGILQTIPSNPADGPFKRFFSALIKGLIRIYVEVFRGTPMILQAVFVKYALPYFTDERLQFTGMWTVSLFVVSVNTGAYMSESVRGGILSVDIGQTEGAKAIGMTHVQIMTNVILPQAIRFIIPQIGNNLIINIKDTSVMFIIGFMDFFAVHKMAAGTTFKYFPSAAIEMPVYLLMTLMASFLLRRLEKRMAGSDVYELSDDGMLARGGSTLNSMELAERGSPVERAALAERGFVQPEAPSEAVPPEKKEVSP